MTCPAQLSATSENAPETAPVVKDDTVPTESVRQSKKEATPDEGAVSDADTEPVVPEEEAAPQPGPSRLARRAFRVHRRLPVPDDSEGKCDTFS